MSKTRERQRIRIFPNPKSSNFKVGSNWIKDTTPNANWVKLSDVTFSPDFLNKEVWFCKDQVNPGPPFKTGGPLLICKSTHDAFQGMDQSGVWTTSAPVFISGVGNRWLQYRGAFTLPNFSGFDLGTNIQLGTVPYLTGSNVVPSLDSWRSLVFSRLRPRLRQMDLAVSLAELRELPKSIRTSAKTYFDDFSRWVHSRYPDRRQAQGIISSSRQVSNEYLNTQFGWIPFVNDVAKLVETTIFLDQIVRDLTNRNNKWEHRQGTFVNDETTQVLTSGGGFRVSPSPHDDMCNFHPGIGRGRYEIRKTTRKRVWASGEFKFYRPEFDDALLRYRNGFETFHRYLTVYGLRISPSVIWNLTPWSWFIDWFFNVGNLLENLESIQSDGVVSRNLFLMCRQEVELVLDQHIHFKTGTQHFSYSHSLQSKQREEADSPYGFGLTGGLSTRQLSIIAALGLSRVG